MPDHYLFPASSLLFNSVFTSVFNGVTSSVGCEMKKILSQVNLGNTALKEV